MTYLDRLTAKNSVLHQELIAACARIRSLELIISHVLEERDHLRHLCGQQHDDILRLQLEHENEERVLRDAVERLRNDLDASVNEQIRLLFQRLTLARHLHALMYLVRPVHMTAQPTPRQGVIVIDLDETEDQERPPMLIERLIAWCRSLRTAQAA